MRESLATDQVQTIEFKETTRHFCVSFNPLKDLLTYICSLTHSYEVMQIVVILFVQVFRYVLSVTFINYDKTFVENLFFMTKMRLKPKTDRLTDGQMNYLLF